ncbi:hypothetical protein RRU94_23770 [Domibacillus sp. DTU_2020_1001157_1_SI_ALB_TIR_016]|uniref:hypothetical protein n=1 Tax=Domibacillus sp. DTU_2020_1001157_1_SI_ALB_TIR_016 TaxID=3077789 RepID=UPI0028EA0FAD|nr:hypothetical protein [Domibacillus sp. DTU_2020_1001157_1_SI_ALB_TIR_016]WNS80480.1 hypothetical protein RRU94_23770 [Domibacillus sp. DTU_2020_1001157_1_SI_ALB_TIR_016]
MKMLSLALAIGFAVLHFSAKYMVFLKRVPRSRFLSFAGGIAVSYVFVHLLPDLNTHQQVLEKAQNGLLRFIENHAYLMALMGLALFYGLEEVVSQSTKKKETKSSSGIFWLHVGVFFFYNMLIGYLLIQETFDQVFGMLFYFLALSVHFMTIDQSMREAHQDVYDQYGRWILIFAVLVGWALGALTELKEAVVSTMVAFLSGALILNVLKEELPKESESSFGAFAAGLIIYSALLLAV